MNIGLAIQTLGLILLCLGFIITYFQNKPTLFSYLANFKDIYEDIKGDNYFQKPRVELRPLEINIPNPNPEIGHDSEYELSIITPNPISEFFLTVKIPDSAWIDGDPLALFNDPVGGERTWYGFKIAEGHATFEIPNAAGKYHLVFGNTQPEELTINDITW